VSFSQYQGLAYQVTVKVKELIGEEEVVDVALDEVVRVPVGPPVALQRPFDEQA
jgi:hypothetical protein